MKQLMDRLGGAFTSIVVAFLIAMAGMIINNRETNAEQRTEITLLKYRLEQAEKRIDKLKPK